MNANGLITLIIAFTCVGLFIATAVATVLDLFNKLKLAPDIRKKLHGVLLVETVVVCVAAFTGFLNPKPIAQKVERVERVETEKNQLENQLNASTKVNQLPVNTLVIVEGGPPSVVYDGRSAIYIRSPDVSRARHQTVLELATNAEFKSSIQLIVKPGTPEMASLSGHKYRVGYWQMGVVDPDPRAPALKSLDIVILSIERVE